MVLAVVLAAVVSYPLGLALGVPWLLPILNTAPAYAAMVHPAAPGRAAAARSS